MAIKFYRIQDVPDPGAYVFALSQPFVSYSDKQMLMANRCALKATIGTKEIASKAGVGGHRTVNLRYGILAHRVADLLDIQVDKYAPESKRPLWTTALAEGLEESGHPWLWRLYPEVCAAIDQLGWTAP